MPVPTPSAAPPKEVPRDTGEMARRIERLGSRSAAIAEALPPLLQESSDSAVVLGLFESLAAVASKETLHLFARHSFLVHYAAIIFSQSPWLGETLVRNLDLIEWLVRPETLNRSRSREEFQASLTELRESAVGVDLAVTLARCKRREYVRILLRDALGIANLGESTAEISLLSDVLIEAALQATETSLRSRSRSTGQAVSRCASKMRFAILALGKLGGNELNYSSDIDLLFLYDSGSAATPIPAHEYFIRLAQDVSELLSRHTSEGQVFRIDLRLRPQGHAGEPAVSLAQATEYYSHIAHDWELQAMIKARASAGDKALAREFLEAVQPYVYRPEVNFAAIKTALTTRERIGRRRRQNYLRKDPIARGTDVKLDPGGIRDIEFLVQCLQRVYGGSEVWLRSRGTLFALQKLHDKEHISGSDFDALSGAYEFLRHVEHRLQLQQGRQVHALPRTSDGLQALARNVSREGTEPPTAEDFLSLVQTRMAGVAAIYQRVIYREQQQARPVHVPAVERPRGREAEPTFAAGYPAHFTQILQRLAMDSPALHEVVTGAELSPHGLHNLDRFLSSAATSPERYATLLRSPSAVSQAVQIFECSDFLTDLLVRYPASVLLLEDLARANNGHPAEPSLAADFASRGEAMSSLRQRHHSRIFLSAARDLLGRRDIFAALEENTKAAEAAIGSVLALTGRPEGFAILALGRLGSREFDLLSDADLVFVCDERSSPYAMHSRAEQIIEGLSAYTRDGTIFAVDARLRPHGREGDLVVRPSRLASYFESAAEPWETLTYLKLRYIAGDEALAERTVQGVRQGIAIMAQRRGFAQSLDGVRQKMLDAVTYPSLKTGPGGTYDIEYVVGRLEATNRVWHVGNLRERLQQLHALGLLEPADHAILLQAATILRTLEHLVTLVTGRSRKWLPAGEHAHRCVQALLAKSLDGVRETSVEELVANVLRQARTLYQRQSWAPTDLPRSH